MGGACSNSAMFSIREIQSIKYTARSVHKRRARESAWMLCVSCHDTKIADVHSSCKYTFSISRCNRNKQHTRRFYQHTFIDNKFYWWRDGSPNSQTNPKLGRKSLMFADLSGYFSCDLGIVSEIDWTKMPEVPRLIELGDWCNSSCNQCCVLYCDCDVLQRA